MAIYHCSLKTLSRSNGHSAVAAAAYRAGALLKDERSGKTHHYKNRKGIIDAFITLPKSAPNEYLNRSVLWNAAEQADNRKNSRTARELVLALPHELTDADRAALTQDMSGWLMERYGVAVDAAIHAPVTDNGDDERNHHAHILFTTRQVTSDGLGKKTRILDGKGSGEAETLVIREVWEIFLNDALVKAGYTDALVDRRSLEEQGIDRIPQTHIGAEGKAASEKEKQTSEDSDDEDEEEGEGKSGKGDSKSPSMAEESAEEAIDSQTSAPSSEEERIKAVRHNTDRGTRSGFVEEIKDLNHKRAAFDDMPLEDQILNLESLMEKLDHKAKRLRTIKDKTKLSSQVKELLKQLFTHEDRDQSHMEAVARNREAKHLKRKAQIKKYGRAYREGIHSKMQRMESYMEIVQEKQSEYQNYKLFVQELEEAIQNEVTVTEGSNSKKAVKTITQEESITKLHLKADFIKDALSEKGYDTVKQIQDSKIINNDTSHIKNNQAEKPNKNSNMGPDADERLTARNPKQKPGNKKSYYTPPSEKTRSFAEEIDANISQDRKSKGFKPFRKAGEEGVKASFNYRDEPTKFTTTREFMKKTKAEAEEKRRNVPPEYRGEPYSEDELAAEAARRSKSNQGKESKFKDFTEGAKAKWDDVVSAAKGDKSEEPKEKPRAKMSGQFNQASGSENREQGASHEYYDGFDL